jgi:hypothetical protein
MGHGLNCIPASISSPLDCSFRNIATQSYSTACLCQGDITRHLYQFQIKAPSLLARLRLLNILVVCLRRLNPRCLDCIFDLKLVLINKSPTFLILYRYYT